VTYPGDTPERELDDPRFEHDLLDEGRRLPHRTALQQEAAWSSLQAAIERERREKEEHGSD
jgi:hypothetical protein